MMAHLECEPDGLCDYQVTNLKQTWAQKVTDSVPIQIAQIASKFGERTVEVLLQHRHRHLTPARFAL